MSTAEAHVCQNWHSCKVAMCWGCRLVAALPSCSGKADGYSAHAGGYSGERRQTIRTQTAQIPLKVAGKMLHFSVKIVPSSGSICGKTAG